MPVISMPKEEDWQGAEFTADFSDENFGFLGSFQEVLPGELEPKKKTKKTKEVSEEQKETVSDEKKKKKKKRNKKNKGKEAESAATEAVDSGEKEAEDVPKDEAEHKKKNKKKKTKKRKATMEEGEESATKKVRFEEPKTSGKADDSNEKEEEKEESTGNEEDSESVDMSAWEKFNLDEKILAALRKLKFTTPTQIQENVILPSVRDRLDILGAAETGSGKTLAFAIPVISRLLAEERQGRGPRALVMAPTRELVVQIVKSFTALCKFTSFSVVSIVGGLAEVKQLRVMSKRLPEIVVATPGRLWDLMQQAEAGSFLADFSGLQCLVVDETDRMVEQGHFKEMNSILESVRSGSTIAKAGKLQTLVFSATLTYVVPEKTTRPGQEAKQKQLSTQEKTKLLVEATGMRQQQHKIVDLTRKFGTAEKLVETRLNCTGLLDKDTHLVYLLKRYSGRTLIFTNSVDASRRLYGILNLLGMSPMMLHANMIQRQRLRNLERFAAQPGSILLATDVAARGLDIKGIEHVVHYQVPKTAEMYIHRSGRTARASESGLTVLMVDPKDSHLYRKMCKNLNRDDDLAVFPIDTEELLVALEERVKLASDLDTLAHRAKKIKLTETWFEKAAREADLDLDHRDRERDQANDEYNSLLRKQDALRAQLRSAMHEPLPDANRQHYPKTRFITPELCAMYDKQVSSRALDDLQSQLDAATSLKRRNRKSIKAHNLKGRHFKKKN